MRSASDNFGRDLGLVHEAVVTGRKAGWGTSEWSKLAHDADKMEQVRNFLRGDAEIVPIVHIVDGDSKVTYTERDKRELVNPRVIHHVPFGVHKWTELKPKLKLFLPELPIVDEKKYRLGSEAFNKKRFGGREFNPERQVPNYLVGKRVANKNLRDFFLQYPHLIPEELKGASRSIFGVPPKRLIFWGTLLREGYDNDRHIVAPGLVFTDHWEGCEHVVKDHEFNEQHAVVIGK